MRRWIYFLFIGLILVIVGGLRVRWSDYILREINGLSEVSRLFPSDVIYTWKYSFADSIGFWVKINEDSLKRDKDGYARELVVQPLNTKIFTEEVSLLNPFETKNIYFQLAKEWAKMDEEIVSLTENSRIDLSKPVFVVMYGYGREGKPPDIFPCKDECAKKFLAMKQERNNFYRLIDKSLVFKISKLAIFIEIIQ